MDSTGRSRSRSTPTTWGAIGAWGAGSGGVTSGDSTWGVSGWGASSWGVSAWGASAWVAEARGTSSPAAAAAGWSPVAADAGCGWARSIQRARGLAGAVGGCGRPGLVA
jgi:hypothetical protein